MLKKTIANHLPFLGKFKRKAVAFMDSVMPARASYSQYKEDIFIWNTLRNHVLDGSIYVDVGANHPTDISNTFLLYRNGLSGVVIEPNSELIGLFRAYRKRDTTLTIGCSNEPSVLKFFISKTPVISSFSNNRGINLYKTQYIPVMPLDFALASMEFSFISLLSIDVEGLTDKVLEGARLTLKKSLIVCLEYDSEEEKESFNKLLAQDFDLLKIFNCNMIFLSKELSIKFLKK
ncbi:hypothetical protein WSM22_43650 [Cytophagales bacterium WSM2-2]|nr:hypothetical protein WSM22_43650 [Cytophagales bacterium WSM2-2]